MAKPRRPVTIYDVAAAAGVAPSTVSRAFSRPGRVSSETAARIHAAAAELGYRTNSAPRMLHTETTGTIALVVSDLSNPNNARLIRGVQSAAHDAGFLTALFVTHASEHTERKLLDRLLPMVDGIVVSGSRMSDRALHTIADKRPLVVLNRLVPGLHCTVADMTVGLRNALRHLHGLGHHTITYIAGPSASWLDGARWRTILDTGSEFGMHVNQLGPFAPTAADGRVAARKLLHYPPTAVIAFDDVLAIGLIRGLDAAGVRVPGDISVVGFGDNLEADFHTPSLTTVSVPLHALGSTAFAELKRLIESTGAHCFPTARRLETQLVVRSSTAAPSAKHLAPRRVSFTDQQTSA